MSDNVVQSPNYVFRGRDCLFGAQNLLIAIGALVMVPMLTGFDPNVALFTAGAGTLLFQCLTRGKVPVFLGSSFAFLPATIYGVQTWGIPATLSGLAVSGLAYFILAAIVKARGLPALDRLLPPIVTGPVIIAIGLVLAPIAVNMASGLTGDGSMMLYEESTAFMLAGIALGVALVTRMFAKGWVKLVPILSGVLAGYAVAWGMGVIDFSPIHEASWLSLPSFVTPEWKWEAILLIFPIALVSAVEHVGDILAIGAITGRPYIRDPGVHRSLMGDGLATALAGCVGGPPNTTYSEVTAGVAITRTFNPAIMTWSALIAIGLSFVGKIGMVLQTIPAPVMGGIMILLFGTIAVIGINLLVESQEDLMRPRAMTIVGMILIIPIGGLTISAGSFQLGGIGLGGLLGVLLNVVLPPDTPSLDEAEPQV